MYRRKRVAAVILAGGCGSRMKAAGNKVYLPLGGRAVVLYAVEAFDRHPYVDELVFVTRAEERAEAEALLQTASLGKPWRVVLGGESRQASVWNAISDMRSEIVLIHDGTRPFVPEQGITACVEALERYDGAVLACKVESPVYSAPRRQVAPRRLDETLYAAQTPQCFYTKTLKACHLRHRANPKITDDSSLLELEGYQVCIVPGDPRNIKLTTPLDMPLAAAYLDLLYMEPSL